MFNNFSSAMPSRLSRWNSMITDLQGMQKYNPARQEDTIDSIISYRDSLVLADKKVSDAIMATRYARANRNISYNKGENSIDDIFKRLKTAVQSQYGKQSTEYTALNSTISNLKYRSSTVTIANTETESAENAQTDNNFKTFHYGEKSYGTILVAFSDVIHKLSAFPDYNPVNPLLKTDILTTKLTEITNLNNDVIAKRLEERSFRKSRSILYSEMRNRFTHIKTHVSTVYGPDSIEFQTINAYSY